MTGWHQQGIFWRTIKLPIRDFFVSTPMVLEYFVKTTLLPNLEGRLGDKSGRDRCWLQIIVHSLRLKSPISSNLDCAYYLCHPCRKFRKNL